MRVLIVDDHTVVRVGLRMLLESQGRVTVVGEATTCAEAVALAAQTKPDVIVFDLDLGGSSGLECLPAVRGAAAGARILVLTGVRDQHLHRQAVHQGATGLVLKDMAVETLLQALEKVHAGEVWLPPMLIAQVLGEMTGTHTSRRAPDPETTKIARLTEREREVVTLIGQGLRNKQIAQRLGVSEATVRHHLTSIFAKLEVADRLELVIYAYRHHLAALPR